MSKDIREICKDCIHLKEGACHFPGKISYTMTAVDDGNGKETKNKKPAENKTG